MNATAAKFILELELGFLNRGKLETLKSLHPFCPILIRCNGGRFTCSAQDAQHFIDIIDEASKKDASADYIRDVAVTAQAIDEARKVPQPKCPDWCLNGPGSNPPPPVKVNFRPAKLQLPPHFNECDCGGVFDGFQVTSDADPGL